MTFHEYIKLKETTGDSWGSPPAVPVQIMLGPNAPLARAEPPENLPPLAKEQFKKPPKPRRTRKEIREQPYDDTDLIKRNIDKARELGVEP